MLRLSESELNGIIRNSVRKVIKEDEMSPMDKYNHGLYNMNQLLQNVDDNEKRELVSGIIERTFEEISNSINDCKQNLLRELLG